MKDYYISLVTLLLCATTVSCTTSQNKESRSPSGSRLAKQEPGTVDAEADDNIVEVEQHFMQMGIPGEYSPAGLDTLARVLTDQISKIRDEIVRKNQGSDGTNIEKVEQKVKKNADIKFLNFALDTIKSARASSGQSQKDTDQMRKAFLLGKRILYSTLVSQAVTDPADEIGLNILQQGPSALLNRIVFNKAKKISYRHLFKWRLFPVLYEYPGTRKPLSLDYAYLESSFLVDPVSKSYMTPQQLVGKTSQEIADLDISEDHPAWKTVSASKEDGWKKTEEFFERAISTHLAKKAKKGGFDFNGRYDMAQARRVVFFDKIKDTATSPKIEVTDAYGMKWKMKWGAEIQTEPLVNRLYSKLGGKYVEHVYVNDPEDFILILTKPKDGGCDASSPQLFVNCLLKSRYNFNVEPYLLDATGDIINTENVDRLLAPLTQGAGLGNVKKSELYGKYLLRFRESSIAFQPDFDGFTRGSPVPFSHFGSLEDRVARSLLLFNMWIWNRDNKDNNNKNYLMDINFGAKGKSKFVYLESQHDMGASLGGVGGTGAINELDTDDSFIFKHKLLPQLNFDESVLYAPTAWNKITHADALWMVRKIAAVTREDIDAIVRETHWPDFVQAATVYKLISRRNTLVGFYGYPPIPNPPPNISLNLGTDANVSFVAKKYNISEEVLRQALSFVPESLRSQYVDTLVMEGQIAKCHNTVLIGVLQREWFPAGLEKRQSRIRQGEFNDVGCDYGRPSAFDNFMQNLEFKLINGLGRLEKDVSTSSKLASIR